MRSMKELLKLMLDWLTNHSKPTIGLCALAHFMHQKGVITESEWEALVDFINTHMSITYMSGTKRFKVKWLKSCLQTTN